MRHGGPTWAQPSRPTSGVATECGRESPLSLVLLFQPQSSGWQGRGNQQELPSENMKKAQEMSKGKRKECTLTTAPRKQRDSENTQQKQVMRSLCR